MAAPPLPRVGRLLAALTPAHLTDAPHTLTPLHPPSRFPQADYQLDQLEEVVEINRAAARLAKKATAAYMAAHPGSRKFVAGAIGPTNKTLSVSPSVENPALRGITYDEVEQAYYEQARALYEGGVDLFLVETIFDTGNAKAAVYALERFFEDEVGWWGAGGCSGRVCSACVQQEWQHSLCGVCPDTQGACVGCRRLHPVNAYAGLQVWAEALC